MFLKSEHEHRDNFMSLIQHPHCFATLQLGLAYALRMHLKFGTLCILLCIITFQ